MTSHVLLISGSLRLGSVKEAALRTAMQLAPDTMGAHFYGGLGELPHFSPDDDREPLRPLVADLRKQVGIADALLFCTPEYAGALPGSFKNLQRINPEVPVIRIGPARSNFELEQPEATLDALGPFVAGSRAT